MLTASPHSATLLLTGQDRDDQVVVAQTYIHTHICILDCAHFCVRAKTEVTDKGSWLVSFSCFDCLCLGRKKCCCHVVCCQTMVLCRGCLGMFFPSALMFWYAGFLCFSETILHKDKTRSHQTQHRINSYADSISSFKFEPIDITLISSYCIPSSWLA